MLVVTRGRRIESDEHELSIDVENRRRRVQLRLESMTVGDHGEPNGCQNKNGTHLGAPKVMRAFASLRRKFCIPTHQYHPPISSQSESLA